LSLLRTPDPPVVEAVHPLRVARSDDTLATSVVQVVGVAAPAGEPAPWFRPAELL
jgi:hypothetical protein